MSLIKSARNVVADAAAAAVFRWPALEPAYIGGGMLLSRVPLVETAYRRSIDTLTGHLRVAGRQFRQITFGSRQIWLDVSEFTAKTLYFRATPYEPATIQWMLEHLRNGNVVVDVGANHGYHSMIAGVMVGERGRVFAFEPNPTVRAQLNEHVQRNGFADRLKVRAAALSDTTADSVDFYVSSSAANSGMSSLDPAWEEGVSAEGRRITVRTERFDEWRQREIPGRIDLVKIDVEGAEDRVVAGMAETLANEPPRHIICETTDTSHIYSVLTSCGYAATTLERIDDLANILFSYRDG